MLVRHSQHTTKTTSLTNIQQSYIFFGFGFHILKAVTKATYMCDKADPYDTLSDIIQYSQTFRSTNAFEHLKGFHYSLFKAAYCGV